MNVGKSFTGHILGSDSQSECKFLSINEADKILYIVAEADDLNLRRLRVRLASQQADYVYGKSDEGSVSHKFDFDRKVDILGLWGKTAIDVLDSDVEQIHSLAFITNECPSRDLLDLESHLDFKK